MESDAIAHTLLHVRVYFFAEREAKHAATAAILNRSASPSTHGTPQEVSHSNPACLWIFFTTVVVWTVANMRMYRYFSLLMLKTSQFGGLKGVMAFAETAAHPLPLSAVLFYRKLGPSTLLIKIHQVPTRRPLP